MPHYLPRIIGVDRFIYFFEILFIYVVRRTVFPTLFQITILTADQMNAVYNVVEFILVREFGITVFGVIVVAEFYPELNFSVGLRKQLL